jgi:predicted nucleic acid-binding protein
VGSAYLAAFSIAASLRLAMLDRRFAQFRGLELELLSA